MEPAPELDEQLDCSPPALEEEVDSAIALAEGFNDSFYRCKNALLVRKENGKDFL